MSKSTTQIFKRPNSKYWWIAYTTPDGIRVRKSSGTTSLDDAKKLAANEYNQVWKEEKLKEKPDYFWEDAVIEWFNDDQSRKEKKHWYLPFLDRYLRGAKLNDISHNLIKLIAAEKKKEGVSNRTVNAVLQQIRVVLKVAYTHDMIDKVPPVKLLKEPKRRIRWLTIGQEKRLMDNLPSHLQPIVKFALQTGLRMSNITGLKWYRVDMQSKIAWVENEESKTGVAIGIPLNSEALDVIRQQIGKHHENVFTYNGKEIKNAGARAWKKAVKLAGLDDFHFHDLRHTWATRHIMNGTSLYELMELGGWSKYDTVRKYAHLSIEHLKTASERVSDTFLTQTSC